MKLMSANIEDLRTLVEHHEMAVYGTLRSWADILGRREDAATLESILQEEKEADELLTSIAGRVNLQKAA